MPKRLTQEEFITKAKSIHGDRYDYSEVVYIRSVDMIKIICPKHGAFKQSAHSHLKGRGCLECGYVKRSDSLKYTTKDFLTKSTLIHGDLYIYSEVAYTGSNDKVKIICTKHGAFEKAPYEHLRGKGCPKCGISKRARLRTLTTDFFIEKAKEVHGNLYDYSKVDYKHNKIKIKIVCQKHGVFKQCSGGHLSGKGCPKCAKGIKTWSYTNWQAAAECSKKFDSYKVYIIRCWNEEEEFYKIGRTYQKVKNRFSGNIPYNYKVIKKIVFKDARECCEYENYLQELNKNNAYLPIKSFKGMYECFSEKPVLK